MLTLKNLYITIFGAATSLLTAFILYWVESQWHFSFYSLMVWFIIPAGAGISGFVAASGYYFGARLFNHKPSRVVLFNMLVVSVATYFFIHYLDYSFLEIEGRSVANYLSFWDYLDISIRNTSVQFRVGRGHMKIGDAIDLQSFGYAYASLQIVGFALGSFVLYLYLSVQIYCEKCFRYFSSKGNITRYMDQKELLVNFLKQTIVLFGTHNLREVISFHANSGSDKCDSKLHHYKADLNLKFCKGCGTHHLGLNVFQWKGKDDWDKIHDLSMGDVSTKELYLNN